MQPSVRGRCYGAARRALPDRLEQQHRGGGGDVQRVDPPARRGIEISTSQAVGDAGAEALPLAAQDEHDRAAEVDAARRAPAAPGSAP